MKLQSKAKLAGVMVALSAAGLMGCAQADSKPMSKAGATTELVQCYGVNKCAGHNDCKTANNACKGHASCKGQGFVSISAKACDDIGGNTKG